MSKRKRKKRKRRPLHRRKPRAERRTKAALQRAFERADRLLARKRAQEAVDLLEPFLESWPRDADLHYYVGYARAHAGDLWGGLVEAERAQKLKQDPDYRTFLTLLYLDTNMRAHVLRALRRLPDLPNLPADMDISEILADMEQEVAGIAGEIGITMQQVEQGLYDMERAQIALHEQDFPASIAASRRSITLLGDWPPPHNNLSLALFWNGQPQQAIATAQRVLSQHPDNVHALSNSIRFLAWSGREEEARALWPRLEGGASERTGERRKIVEAAAILDQDESVYQLLHAVDESSELDLQEQYFLAVADANTGRQRQAQRRLEMLRQDMPWADVMLEALQAGRPGPGWAGRYPYFHSIELVPVPEMGKLTLLAGQQDLSSQAVRGGIKRFVARFPQSVRMAEKLIWEEGQPEAGISLLAAIATPAAYDALRRLGLSQAGDDQLRMRALSELMQGGEIARGEQLRVWLNGEWRDVQLRGYEVSGEFQTQYTPAVADLINRGTSTQQQGDFEQAERLFQRALELNPNTKEAYNNLGVIYARRDERARAREMFRAALEIDPLYVFPRCNLASYLLDEDDVEGAQAMLDPLADVTRFHPQDIVYYHYTQARILIRQEEYEAARMILEAALDAYPDYEPAQNLLERLKPVEMAYGSFWERMRGRDRAKRTRLQAQLATPEPTLAEALPLYTKNALVGMGRVVIRRGGWSALRKAEMIQVIVDELTELDNLERIIAGLSASERECLRWVLADGGAVNWEEFDARYGNDLDESPYWEWHTPETVMGSLRLRGLLVEATVDGALLIVVPGDLRSLLRSALG